MATFVVRPSANFREGGARKKSGDKETAEQLCGLFHGGVEWIAWDFQRGNAGGMGPIRQICVIFEILASLGSPEGCVQLPKRVFRSLLSGPGSF